MTSSRPLSAPRLLGGTALLATLLLAGCAPAATTPAPATSSAAGGSSTASASTSASIPASTGASTPAAASTSASTARTASSSSAAATTSGPASAAAASSAAASTTKAAAPASAALSSAGTASSAPASPSATATRAAGVPTASPKADCAGVTGAEALAADSKAVRPGGYPWDTAHPLVDAFDDCAALSAVVVHIQGPTGSSPHQVSLYHEGRFIGHATVNDFGFTPRIERISDDTLRIVYTYNRETAEGMESTADASGEAPLTITYDSATGSLERSGYVPPRYPKKEAVPEAPLDGNL